MTPFGKKMISGILYGLVLGLFMWIAGTALVTIEPSFPATITPLALLIIGWVASVGIAYADDAHLTKVDEEELQAKIDYLLKKAKE